MNDRARPRRSAGLLFVWLASAFSLWLTAQIVPGIAIEGFGRALLAAAVLGLLNAVVRPLLVLLTLPVTVLTLGLFLLVVNASMIGLAAWLLDGFTVAGLWPAVLGAVVLSVVSSLVSWLFDRET